MKRLLVWLGASLGTVLMLLVLLMGTAVLYAKAVVNAQPGQLPPCCVLPNTNLDATGKTGAVTYTDVSTEEVLKLSEFSKEPHLLVFFATWCAACVEEAPALEELAAEGVPLLLLSTTETVEEARAWITKHAPSLKAGVVEGQGVASSFKVFILPTIILFDEAGSEVARWRGATPLSDLREAWLALEKRKL
jgi:thiol-disulfide isomerase/thioredoxin